MIEHLRLADGLKMLEECFRVLRSGGRIRISTPDLRFLIELEGDRTELQERYVEWSAATFVPHIKGFAGESLVINNYMRDWGHQFIYDERTLRAALESCGFCETTRHRLNDSADENLRDLENAQRMPDGFLALETMTLEARKP
jgi:predicted SAM-dependent methyltransferase